MPETPLEINTSEPHPARIYDYFIGGKNHFAADRETAAEVLRRSPAAHIAARENWSFLGRAVSYLTAEAGIRQFLDIGTGLPTTDNVHEVAQEIAPSARVVYVDNDPLCPHPRARPADLRAEGRTAYIHADLRDPAAILSHPDTRALLDFGQPIALMLVAILHFAPDEFKPAESIATLVDALAVRQLPRGLAPRRRSTTRSPRPPGSRDAQAAWPCRSGIPMSSPASRSPGLNWCRQEVVLVSGGGPRPAPAAAVRGELLRGRGQEAVRPCPDQPGVTLPPGHVLFLGGWNHRMACARCGVEADLPERPAVVRLNRRSASPQAGAAQPLADLPAVSQGSGRPSGARPVARALRCSCASAAGQGTPRRARARLPLSSRSLCAAPEPSHRGRHLGQRPDVEIDVEAEPLGVPLR